MSCMQVGMVSFVYYSSNNGVFAHTGKRLGWLLLTWGRLVDAFTGARLPSYEASRAVCTEGSWQWRHGANCLLP